MKTTLSYLPTQTLGPVKPMHAVGQPPFLGIDFSYIHYLQEANIPYSRLHDVGGMFGGNLFVDIPNIFRDFAANVDDPASYDFTFTDLLLTALVENNCEPYFRLGVTIENYHDLKSYRIDPPSDNEKWAKICEHIIRHYNEGWANGFHYNIKYWEIWNEPDNGIDNSLNAMWHGTKEQYYDLYRVTSKHLRKCFGDSIKIGGYASCGFYVVHNGDIMKYIGNALGMGKKAENVEFSAWELRILYFEEFFNGFIDMVAKENLPLDFFSHHSYASVENTVLSQKYCEKRLEEAGLGHVEIHLNEWMPQPSRETRGKSVACANAVAMMCAMQNTKMEVMCFYDARIGTSMYGGLFNPLTFEPFCTYYGFKAFGKLYALGTQVTCSADNPAVYSVAATDGKTNGVLIANTGEATQILCPFTGKTTAYLIDEDHFMTETDIHASDFVLEPNQVIYIEETI